MQRATTEELRDALLGYRSLFDELLRVEQPVGADGVRGETAETGRHNPARRRTRKAD